MSSDWFPTIETAIQEEYQRLVQITRPDLALCATHLPGQVHYRLPNRHKYRIQEFEAFLNPYDFIDAAYQAMLKRLPLPDEKARALQRLRHRGYSRARILKKLQQSPEGRQYKVRIKGLWLGNTLSFPLSIPVLGPVLEWIWTVVSIPYQINRLRHQLEDTQYAQCLHQSDLTAATEYNLRHLATAIDALAPPDVNPQSTR